MISPKLKGRLLVIHRWIALALSPVLLLIILSGLVLSLKPIVTSWDTQAPASVDPQALVAAIDAVDPTGSAKSLAISQDGKTMTLNAQRPGASAAPAISPPSSADGKRGPRNGADPGGKGVGVTESFDISTRASIPTAGSLRDVSYDRFRRSNGLIRAIPMPLRQWVDDVVDRGEPFDGTLILVRALQAQHAILSAAVANELLHARQR